MKKNNYYTTGEFAKKAKVSIRTIRYYDKEGILKPTFINEAGYRFYSDADFAKLQKILTLKYLGFTLEEIIDFTINDNDSNYVAKSFELQLELVRKKMEYLQLVEKSIVETSKQYQTADNFDWDHMIHLIQLMNMEKSIIEQYKSASNLKIRIQLHNKYSTNKIGWYPWIYSLLDITSNQRILDIGCADAELWKVNKNLLPDNITIALSDISEGMIQAAKENLMKLDAVDVESPNKRKDKVNAQKESNNFMFQVFDCHEIPYEENQFDVIVANHVLFYLKDLDKALEEIRRVLKPGGLFVCSTYGSKHMKEVTEMTKEFDSRINLSEVDLYEIFGLDNGKAKLKKYFNYVDLISYEDSLIVDNEQLLMDYVLSCHGNQKDYIMHRNKEFKDYIHQKIAKKGSLCITKDAGVFRCRI